VFVPDFNRRFTVAPAQPPSAFTPVPKGMDLSLLLSIKHDRRVRNDNTVIFRNLILQLSSTRSRLHFVRCPVTVHEFSNRTLGVSYEGQLLGRYDSNGGPLPTQPKRKPHETRRPRTKGSGHLQLFNEADLFKCYGQREPVPTARLACA
jgi:hypothetical protein